ncbi:hypothetical protein FRB90_003224 [Tulasnella sp. 427]|nr:hypothetical protein FRB90_003224 [Tulasnella sp. 427]
MKLSTLFSIPLAFVPSLVSAAAIDNTAPRNETIVKRGGEVNYLLNCYRNKYLDDSVSEQYTASYAAWYSNIDNSHNGERPDALSSEYRNWDANGDYLQWEEKQQNIYYPGSGFTLQTHLERIAKYYPPWTYSGTVQRVPDGKTFNCYKLE